MTKEEKNQCTEKLKNLIKKLASNNIKNEAQFGERIKKYLPYIKL